MWGLTDRILLLQLLSLATNVGSLFRTSNPRPTIGLDPTTDLVMNTVVDVGMGKHFIYLGVDGMVQFVKACASSLYASLGHPARPGLRNEVTP